MLMVYQNITEQSKDNQNSSTQLLCTLQLNCAIHLLIGWDLTFFTKISQKPHP